MRLWMQDPSSVMPFSRPFLIPSKLSPRGDTEPAGVQHLNAHTTTSINPDPKQAKGG